MQATQRPPTQSFVSRRGPSHEQTGGTHGRRDAAPGARNPADGRVQALAKIVHELRTPLNGIIGFSRLLRVEPGLSEAQLRMIEIIERCGQHQLALVNDLLTLAQLDQQQLRLRPEWIDLRAVIEQSIEMVRAAAEEKGLALRLVIEGDLPDGLRADALRLRQVLVNLLANAVKFTDQGLVLLSVQVVPMGAGCCTHARRTRFSVQDTGCGFGEAQAVRLGNLFTRLKDDARHPEGSGVGLAVARELVHLMGGELRWSSVPGRGTRFYFDLEPSLAP